MVDFSNPAGVCVPGGLYSHTAFVKAGTDLLYLAGQTGTRPDGGVPDSIEDQADAAYANVVTLLKAHGLGPTNIVKMQVFVTDRAYRDGANVARRKYLGDHRPTSTFLIIQGLARPELKIEVDVVAAR